MLERPECTGPFLPLFLRAPRTPLGHHNQLAQGPREHCLIYMTIIFGWLQVRCAREACAARGTRLHPLIHFRNCPFLGVAWEEISNGRRNDFVLARFGLGDCPPLAQLCWKHVQGP